MIKVKYNVNVKVKGDIAMSCEENLKVIETGEAEWGYWNNVQLFPYHGLVFGHKNLRKNKRK